MNWADIAILAVILISVLVSILRGFVKEVLSLVAWIVAFWAAATFAAPASTLLEPYVALPTARLVIGFVAVLVAALLAVGLINFVIGKLLEGAGLSGTDRLLGAVFGFARGAAVVVIAVLLAGLTALPAEPWWREARIIAPFEAAALRVLEWLPPDLARNFSF
ncbi:MAG: CvpA family protein [Gammaproteobacteria bacterium]